MSIFFERKPKPFENVDATQVSEQELRRHHAYDEEIAAYAYISPVVLPYRRLEELKGDATLVEMSDKSKISTRELSLMLNTEYLEPTTTQLLMLGMYYNVSILWLLGYHTKKESHYGGGDREILAAVAKRNGVERSLHQIKGGGFFADYFRRKAEQRLQAANLEVSATAARIVARERIPMTSEELFLMMGQPIFVELKGIEDGEWGIIEDDYIHTRNGNLYYEDLGTRFEAYMMPQTGVNSLST